MAFGNIAGDELRVVLRVEAEPEKKKTWQEKYMRQFSACDFLAESVVLSGSGELQRQNLVISSCFTHLYLPVHGG